MPFNTNNTNNPFGAFATSTGPSVPATPFSGPAPATPYTPTSTGSSGIVVTNPFIPATPSSPTTPSGGTGSVQGGGTTNQQLITRTNQVGSNSPTPWFPNPGWAGTDLPLYPENPTFQTIDGETYTGAKLTN